MTDREEEPLTPGARETREALRTATRPEADPAFRARLKQEFVTGGVAAREPRGTDVVAGVTSTRPWFRRPAIGVAVAAAAAVIVVSLAALNRGPDWELASVAGNGTAQINGVAVGLGDRDQLRRGLRPGVRVTLPAEGEIVLQAGKALALQLTPGTEVTVPPPPARWFGRSSRMEMRAGEARISTGTRFRGARFAVRTPFASVAITGTTIAVIQDSTFTCVCVLDGVASMGEADDRMVEVSAGMRRFLYRDLSPSRVEPIDEMQRMKLTMFRDASRTVLNPEP